MLRSEKKVSQVTSNNPTAMTHSEISGNDREKALELLNRLKQREHENKINKQKNSL
jgi:hypothetical protein